MDSIHVTNYELNVGLGLRMALVTDIHSMPYDDFYSSFLFVHIASH